MTADRNASWHQAMKGISKLPPFSPVLNRLTGEMAREAVSFAKLAELIETDAVLAGNVLRVVNSPLYGLRAEVSSVRHAVSILGLSKLRNIVLSLSVSQLWNHVRTPAGWSMSHFNRHSLAVAMLADLLALETGIEYAEGAFSAGLLHDMGKLLIAVAFPDQTLAIDRLAGPDWHQANFYEETVLELSHAELSAAALTRWNLPVPIVDGVLNHHTPPAGGRLALANVLYAADCAANECGHGSRAAVVEGTDPAAYLAEIGLAQRAESLLDEFHRSFKAIREFF